jgi:RNA polymerase sigma factor (sigma-70 family)
MTADMPYEALYVEHEPAARRLALALVPPHAAEDVVAEAFTAVLDTSLRQGPPAAFRPYLLAAVRNTARRYHDRGRRLVPVADPEPAPSPGPEPGLLAREDARLAAQAFATLPERWRQVLWATAVEEITIAALANRWGMTANSVSQLASRAREGLRQAYLTGHLGAATAPACRAVAPYMGAAVRGRAGKRHAAGLAAHLSGCARCSQAHAGLAAMNTSLGELLVPAAGGTALLAHVLPAARAAGRGWHLHPLAALTAASVAVAGGLAAVPFTAHGPGPAQARAQAASSPPGGTAGVTASASPVRAPAGRPGAAGSPAPSAPGSALVPSVLATVTGTVHQVAGTAGQAVSSAGSTAGQAVAGAGQTAGQAVGGVAGQPAGGAVSAVGGTGGNLVQQVTGTAGGLLGGL